MARIVGPRQPRRNVTVVAGGKELENEIVLLKCCLKTDLRSRKQPRDRAFFLCGLC